MCLTWPELEDPSPELGDCRGTGSYLGKVNFANQRDPVPLPYSHLLAAKPGSVVQPKKLKMEVLKKKRERQRGTRNQECQ